MSLYWTTPANYSPAHYSEHFLRGAVELHAAVVGYSGVWKLRCFELFKGQRTLNDYQLEDAKREALWTMRATLMDLADRLTLELYGGEKNLTGLIK